MKPFYRLAGNDPILFFTSVFAVLLYVCRVAISDSLYFGFLIWNLFLGFIPLWVSMGMRSRNFTPKLELLLYFFVWLFFVPNSFYIITDLFHLKDRPFIPVWYDLVTTLTFAWAGFLAGIISMKNVKEIIEVRFGVRSANLFPIVIFPLIALGVYIGRFWRYNSWDIITNPVPLIQDLIAICIHPIRNVGVWGMVACFTLFLLVIYYSIMKQKEA